MSTILEILGALFLMWLLLLPLVFIIGWVNEIYRKWEKRHLVIYCKDCKLHDMNIQGMEVCSQDDGFEGFCSNAIRRDNI
ncbi:MAG: hypothetical protein H6Q71_2738 [Firmicutes bacterium]|nr:hypothetical protein [Bacillota bacterium]